MKRTRVYYNSACPVCDAGIRHQRRRLDTADSSIEWVDVHTCPTAVGELGTELETVRERLHVVDEQGTVHVGAEAFAELWHRTPGQSALARLVRLPGLHLLARWAYNGFARLLYRWNRWKGRW